MKGQKFIGRVICAVCSAVSCYWIWQHFISAEWRGIHEENCRQCRGERGLDG